MGSQLGDIGGGYADEYDQPSAIEQPLGTQIIFDYRGATGFTRDVGVGPFDAEQLDAYGDISIGEVNFLNDVAIWTRDIDDIDGAQYFQVRISFINNISTGLHAEMAGIGFPFADL